MNSKVYDADQPLIVEEKTHKKNLTSTELMEMAKYNIFNVQKLSRRLNLVCLPTWKSRTLILSCGFIFKYASEKGILLKGVPIDLTLYEMKQDDEEHGPNTICLSSLSKKYVFAFSDPREMEQFQKDVIHQREWRIKSKLGHVPISSSEQYIITFAENLCSTKERVNNLISQDNLSSVEYSSFA